MIKQPHSQTLILLNAERRRSLSCYKEYQNLPDLNRKGNICTLHIIIEPAAVITAVGKWYNIDTLQSCVSTYQFA